MTEDQRQFLYFLGWVAIGVGLIVLLSRRWQPQFDSFASRKSLQTVAFLALAWPIALVWLLFLEGRNRLAGSPRPSWPGGADREVHAEGQLLPPATAAVLLSPKGLLLGLASVSLAILAMQQWPTLSTYTIGLFFPLGGFFVGVLAGVGYGLGNRLNEHFRVGRFAIVGGLLGVVALLLDRSVTCARFAPVDLPFRACYQSLLTHTQIEFSSRSQGHFVTGPLGPLGYLEELLVAIGSFAGAALSVVGAYSFGDHGAQTRGLTNK